MNMFTLKAFVDELQKAANVPTHPVLPPSAKNKLLLALGAGTALALEHGGKRVLQDVQTGEQLRKGSGGGYY